jgi:hypothetical protein
VESNYNDTNEGFPQGETIADNPEPLLVNGCTISDATISGGQLSPTQYADLTTGSTYASASSVPAGDPYATIYTYVTATNSVGCNASMGSCAADARRVVLVSVLDHEAPDAGPSYPTYSTTVFTNPVPSNAPASASGLQILGTIS